MRNTEKGIRIAGLGSLAVALALAGCGGSGPMGSAAGGPSVASNGANLVNPAMLVSPDKKHHRSGGKSCAPVSLTQNFNNTGIAAGSYILFTSVTQMPGNANGVKVQVTNSKIGFTSGSTTYTIKGPDSKFTIGAANVKLGFKSNTWKMRAPAGTHGNDFLTDIVYQVPANLPGNIRNVTWSAKFFSKSNLQNQQMHWQWGAAVYSTLTNTYTSLGVKPVDDQDYPPYNNDPAGTPENFKSYLMAGGTGNGNNQYTGVGGPNGNVTPCK